MDIPIELEEFQGRGLAFRTAGVFKGSRLLLDGAEVKGKRGKYSVRDNHGREVVIPAKGRLFDPVPKIVADSREIELARPLSWYEYVWIGLPILLIFVGGALGALLGVFATHISATIFRSDKSALARFGLTGLIAISAVGLFIAGATLVHILLG